MATEKNQTLAVKWRISLAVKPSTHWDLQLLGKSCGQETGRKPVTALEDILKLSFTFPIMLFSFAAKWLGCRRAGEFNVWGQFSTGGFLHMWSTSRDLVFSETYGQNANLIPYYTIYWSENCIHLQRPNGLFVFFFPPVLNGHLQRTHSNESKNNLSSKTESIESPVIDVSSSSGRVFVHEVVSYSRKWLFVNPGSQLLEQMG